MFEDDEKRILETFRIIKKHMKYIETQDVKSSKEFIENPTNFYAISMAVFNIYNNLIDLGQEFIEKLDLPYPTKYREIPKILFDYKIITLKQFKLFDQIIVVRNNIAHEYDSQISEEKLFWCLQNLDFLNEFMKIVKKRLFE